MLADKVNIVYGSSAALWGSGNVGGALMLESNAPVFGKNALSLQATAGAGSFHQYTGGIKASWHARKWAADLKIFGQTAENDFSYTDISGQHTTTNNAHLRSGSILSRVAYKPDAYNVLTLHAWLQQYNREIPPALFESSSVKEQRDAATRFLLHWQHNRRQHYYVKAAVLNDILAYNDAAVQLDTRTTTNHYYAEAGWEKTFTHSRLLIFAPIQLFTLSNNEQKQQTRAALAMAYNMRLLKNKLEVALNARAEQVDVKTIFLPGINASLHPLPWLTLKANVQRTYRAPTLNELYYDPGGNRNLKAEEGWHMDAGYSIKKSLSDHMVFEHGISAFNRYIDNWIIWFGGAIWTPHNIAGVHSRGIETENKLIVRTGRIQWHMMANAAFIASTTTRSEVANDNSIGKQIPYAPRFSMQGNAGFTWRNLYVNYNHTYTGTRYVTTDESQAIDPYQTGNIQVAYKCLLHHTPLTMNVQCQNIWDQKYEVVGARPMPGINWLAGFTISLGQ